MKTYHIIVIHICELSSIYVSRIDQFSLHIHNFCIFIPLSLLFVQLCSILISQYFGLSKTADFTRLFGCAAFILLAADQWNLVVFVALLVQSSHSPFDSPLSCLRSHKSMFFFVYGSCPYPRLVSSF